jgi:hypothetical protein
MLEEREGETRRRMEKHLLKHFAILFAFQDLYDLGAGLEQI